MARSGAFHEPSVLIEKYKGNWQRILETYNTVESVYSKSSHVQEMFTYRPLFHTSMRAVRYAICEATNAAHLTFSMDAWVRKGWEPIGGVSRRDPEWDEHTGEMVVYEYSQACVKYSHR